MQTAVIAGARAFVGTYGGYAYLAPFCNVPAIAFYSDARRVSMPITSSWPIASSAA